MVARLLLLLAVGCATTAPPSGPPKPLPLEDEVVNAARVAAEQPNLVVRYNPVPCSCPPFEVQLGARWVRLQLEGVDNPESTAASLQTRAKGDLEQGQIRHYTVKGDLNDSLNRCAQGALFLTLSVASEVE